MLLLDSEDKTKDYVSFLCLGFGEIVISFHLAVLGPSKTLQSEEDAQREVQ